LHAVANLQADCQLTRYLQHCLNHQSVNSMWCLPENQLRETPYSAMYSCIRQSYRYCIGWQSTMLISVCVPSLLLHQHIDSLLVFPLAVAGGSVCLLSSCSWVTLCPARAPTRPPPLALPLLPPSHPPLLLFHPSSCWLPAVG
jgi:hypothetical protein